MRASSRQNNELRPVELVPDVNRHAEGSCLVKFGHTHVLCTASVEEKLPAWLKGKNQGWVTAEYGMLPRSTHDRIDREAARGKQSGRTQEIQRLIGRALRAVVDLQKLGERQIKIDCDVIQADGGTRTAAITGAYIALARSIQKLQLEGKIQENPLRESVAAISCGVVNGEALLDLEYTEDSSAEVDANFVITASGKLVEVQGTGESHPFTRSVFDSLMNLAEKGCADLSQRQRQTLEKYAHAL